MNYPEFAHGYRDLSHQSGEGRVVPAADKDPGFEKEFQEARQWDRYFGELVMRHLQSQPIDPDIELPKALNDYILWSLEEVPRLYKLAKDATLSDYDKYGDYLSELVFHLTAPRMEDQWHMIIDPSYKASVKYTVASQSWLAAGAADIARDRKIKMIHEEKSGTRNGIVGRYNGLLTDFDTLVTGLELRIDNVEERDLVVVSAPSRFEATRSTRNSDALIFDREKRHARGVQAKTRIGNVNEDEARKDIFKRYNPAFVSFVDGMTDLGNSTDERLAGGRHRAIPFPGLISMDHLIRTPLNQMPTAGLKGEDLRYVQMMHRKSRQIALELSRGRKNFIPMATRNISERLLTDLYRS